MKKESRMSNALDELMGLAAGLLVTSESDYPLEAFRWSGPGPLTAEGLRAHLGLPAGTPAARCDLAAFFASQSQVRDEGSPEGLAHAARFAALGRRLNELLAEAACYRVGTVEVRLFLVGRDATGATVGLSSTLIET
jgi:Nuclease A inhibitor-like protein